MSKEKKNWTGNKRSTFSTVGSSNHVEHDRAEQDYYATDPTAIDDLFKVEDFSDTIWEPACGECHLAHKIEEYGKNVYKTDIVDRGCNDHTVDFLEEEVDWHGDIITNPPYRYAKEFVEQSLNAIDEGQKVAMFLKLLFLESQKRYELFQKAPPVRIYVYSSRKICALNGDPKYFEKSGAACYAWFIWEKGFNGDPVIKWIK